MKTTKNSLLVLIMFSALTTFAAGNGDTGSAGRQIADPRIKNAYQQLKSPQDLPPTNSAIVGVSASKKAFEGLLFKIDQELQMARPKHGNKYDTAVLSVTQKLVDFQNRTEPSNIFDNDEVEEIRRIDQAAEDLAKKLRADLFYLN
ncbi:hypothetical protein D3C87_90280 [compost metagenome]